jgi:hypothetical protein
MAIDPRYLLRRGSHPELPNADRLPQLWSRRRSSDTAISADDMQRLRSLLKPESLASSSMHHIRNDASDSSLNNTGLLTPQPEENGRHSCSTPHAHSPATLISAMAARSTESLCSQVGCRRGLAPI